MQLDATQIVIRERRYPDILDLALRVVRAHAVPLLITSVLGAAPLMLLDVFLLHSLLPEFDLLDEDDLFTYGFRLFAGSPGKSRWRLWGPRSIEGKHCLSRIHNLARLRAKSAGPCRNCCCTRCCCAV